MGRVKKQHYVPRLYLRRFASPDGRIFAFNKLAQRSYQTNIADAASETRFYDIHPDFLLNLQANIANGTAEPIEAEQLAKVLDPQLVEHELGAREARFAPILTDILASLEQKRGITTEQRWRMAEFVALQAVRTPDARKRYIDIRRSVFPEFLRQAVQTAGNPLGVEETLSFAYDERYASLDHARLIFHPDFQKRLSLALARHGWLFGENVTSIPFYTSDTPVTKRGYFTDPGEGVGWDAYGVEVTFPLTPRWILILLDRAAFPRMAQLDGQVVPITAELVAEYNSLQVILSQRAVFCSRGAFLPAVELCSEYPEICSREPLH